MAWTSPQLEITIAQNVHYGPGVPSGSASVVSNLDSFGNSAGGTFTLDASVAGASCALNLTRNNAPFSVGAYQISADYGTAAPDGVIYPSGSESVTTPQGNGLCNGTDCDGDTLVLNELDATHVYGYFMAGDINSPVICTFWLPISN